MSADMPDFSMPSEEDIEAGRRAVDTTSTGEQAQVPPRSDTPVGAPRDDRRARRSSPLRLGVLRFARNPVVAFATGAVVVAAGFLAAPAITTWTERGSLAQLQRVLQEYEHAINTGDVEAALALHAPGEHLASMALLDAGVAPTTPPSISCEVPQPDPRADVAIARCTMGVVIDGSMGESMPVRLERADGAWRLASGLEQPAYVDPTLYELVSLAGVPMAGLLDDDRDQYWLLPGSYESEIRSSDLIELDGDGELRVGGGGGSLAVSASPVDAVVTAAEAAALAYAESCVAEEQSAASCGVAPPPTGRELTATFAQWTWMQDPLTIALPVRIGGTGSAASPEVEVLVRFDETWTSYELEVTGVAGPFG